MTVVGIRELKNRLSEYLRLVKSGQRVLITDLAMLSHDLRIRSACLQLGFTVVP